MVDRKGDSKYYQRLYYVISFPIFGEYLYKNKLQYIFWFKLRRNKFGFYKIESYFHTELIKIKNFLLLHERL